MAKNVMFTYPLDTPVLTRPGVMYAESDYSGNAKWLATEPGSPERMAKGDLGSSNIPNFASHYSFEGGTGAPPPFVLKKGR